jgi:flagellar biosynthesis protein FlhB
MSDKIHPPTPRRRKQAKEQGRAPRSGEIVMAGLLLATAGLLDWYGPSLVRTLMALLSDPLDQPALLSFDRGQSYRMIAGAFASVASLVLPMLIVMMMCSVGLNVLQTGLIISPAKLMPSLDRISPGKRLKSITSLRSIGQFGVTVLKLVAIIAVSITVLRTSLPNLIHVTEQPLATIGSEVFRVLIRCCVFVGATLLAFACVDYSLAWWQHERELMMTEQELREEIRDAEGAKQAVKTARSQAVQGVA